MDFSCELFFITGLTFSKLNMTLTNGTLTRRTKVPTADRSIVYPGLTPIDDDDHIKGLSYNKTIDRNMSMKKNLPQISYKNVSIIMI